MLTEFVTQFGTPVSIIKNKLSNGFEDTTEIVYEKAPSFLVTHRSLKVTNGLPAIRWMFASKTICKRCSFTGHYENQCPYERNTVMPKPPKTSKNKQQTRYFQNKSSSNGFNLEEPFDRVFKNRWLKKQTLPPKKTMKMPIPKTTF